MQLLYIILIENWSTKFLISHFKSLDVKFELNKTHVLTSWEKHIQHQMIFKLNFVSKTLVKPKFIFVNIFNYFTFVNKSVGFSFTSIVKPLRNICDFSNFLHLIFYKCFVFFLDYGYPGQRVCPKIKNIKI